MFARALALTVTALALVAPPAHAEHPEFDCNFQTTDRDTNLGGGHSYVGVAYGYIVSPTPGEGVSIRCYVSVDTTPDPGGSTNLGAGTGAAYTAGPVTYMAGDTQDVDLCAEWTAGSESGTTCFETTTTPIPPQEVIDLADGLLFLAHGLSCIALNVAYAGVPGVVEVRPGGDVYVLGSRVWDC